MLKHSMRDMLKLLGVAALYALLAQLTLAVSAANGFVCVIWPASGLALAALLMGGKRYAWGVFLGALLTYVMVGKPLGVAAAIASGNTLEALFGAWLVTRGGRFDPALRSLRDYLRLIVRAGFFGVSVSALTGTMTLLASGFIAAGTYSHDLLHWWMGDALGIMLIAPLILVWRQTQNDRLDAKRVLEAILVVGLTFLAGQVVFLGWINDTAGLVARGYWIYLLVTWAAVRLGTRGVTVVLIMTAVQALLGAYYGTGFFADDIAKTQLTNYWFYMVILSVVGMALATHFTERKQLEQQLSRRLRHRNIMEHITQISLSSASVEELLESVLDEILTVFNADRAYFLYPCNPDAPSWSVPMERTRPEWPGAFARGLVLPMTPEAVEIFRELLASTKPLPYGPATSRCIPVAGAEQFSIRSMIQMALRPRVDSPWIMGLHHCAQARAYDEDDLLIFGDIGQRVADALNSMIMLKNLRESEANLRAILDNMQDLFYRTDQYGQVTMVSASVKAVLGYEQEEVVGRQVTDLYADPDARGKFLEKLEENGGAVQGYEIVLRHKDGSLVWVSTNSHFYRDGNGNVAGVEGVGRDITRSKQAELALSRYKLVIDTINDGFWITDKTGNVLEANAAYGKISGYSVDELVNIHISQLEAVEQSVEDVKTHIEKVIAQGYERFETRHRHKDGHEIDVEISATFMSESQQFFVFIHDITERKLAVAALRESEANLRAILDNSPYLVWLKDTGGRYIKVNKVYADYIRLKDIRQIIGKTDFDLWPKDLAEKYRADDAEVMSTRQQKYTEEQSLDGGRMHWVETFKTPITDENGNVLGTTGFARDITGRKQAEEKIHQLAFYDLLTGLPNRRLLNDRLDQTLAASKRSGRYGALMFMDLDNFKPLNDTHGHGVGDLLLMEVARRITSCVREVDTVARFGGDEFVVILSELDADKTGSLAQVGIVAEKIRAILAEPYVLAIQQEGKAEAITVEHHCTSSIGVVLFIGHEFSAEDIIKWADMAMYQAKDGGRNLIRFYE